MKRYNKLLAGASWMAEYGNPDTEDWDYIKTWSPYQNLDRDEGLPQGVLHDLDPRRPRPSRPRAQDGGEDDSTWASRSTTTRTPRAATARRANHQPARLHVGADLRLPVEDAGRGSRESLTGPFAGAAHRVDGPRSSTVRGHQTECGPRILDPGATEKSPQNRSPTGGTAPRKKLQHRVVHDVGAFELNEVSAVGHHEELRVGNLLVGDEADPRRLAPMQVGVRDQRVVLAEHHERTLADLAEARGRGSSSMAPRCATPRSSSRGNRWHRGPGCGR